MAGGLAPLGIFESFLNTAQQGIGAGLSGISQMFGQGQLWGQIDPTKARIQDQSNWAFNRAQDVMHGGTQGAPTNPRADAGAGGRRSGGYVDRMAGRASQAANWQNDMPQGGEFKNFTDQQAADRSRVMGGFDAANAETGKAVMVADRLGSELVNIGRTQIATQAAANATAATNFESDRASALGALRSDFASNMQTFEQANNGLVAEGLRSAQEALEAAGLGDDPLARLQAEQQVRGQYRNQLGTQARSLQDSFSNRLANMHATLISERTKLFDASSARMNEAFGMGAKTIADAADSMTKAHLAAGEQYGRIAEATGNYGIQQNRDRVDAFARLSADARESAAFQNHVDEVAMNTEISLAMQTAANNIAAEQLAFGGWQTLAGMISGTTWAVPQWNMATTAAQISAASSSGGSSGGSFSAGIPGVFSYNSGR